MYRRSSWSPAYTLHAVLVQLYALLLVGDERDQVRQAWLRPAVRAILSRCQARRLGRA